MQVLCRVSFVGIRYAEPPVGKLRWKKPEPVKSFEGVMDARTAAPVCPQVVPEVTGWYFYNIVSQVNTNYLINIIRHFLIFCQHREFQC